MARISPTWSFEPMIVAEVEMALGVRPLQAAKVRVILAATLVQAGETKVSKACRPRRESWVQAQGRGAFKAHSWRNTLSRWDKSEESNEKAAHIGAAHSNS